MNEDIKEILEDIQNFVNGDTWTKYFVANIKKIMPETYAMNFDTTKKILDYIISLQEELKSANESINWWTNRFKAVEKENQRLNKVIEDIDKYIHIFKIEDIGEKTMLILNDILLIKNGLGKDVVRLNKLTELKNEVE